jgi:hypothetical protein
MNISDGAQSRRPEYQLGEQRHRVILGVGAARVLIFLARCEMLAIHRR